MRLKHILNETQRMKTDWKNLIFTKQKSKKEIKNKTREIKKKSQTLSPRLTHLRAQKRGRARTTKESESSGVSS